MSTYISLILAVLINFSSSGNPENKKSIKNNSTQNQIITGFPYQYFEGEVLTDEMVESRIRLIYMSVLIAMMVPSSVSPTVAPIVGQTRFPSTSTSIERSTPNQLDFHFKQLYRGGAKTPPNKVLTQWLGKQNNPGAGIMLNRINRGGPGMPGAVLTRPKPATPSAGKHIKRGPANGAADRNGPANGPTNRNRRLTSRDDEAQVAFTPNNPKKYEKKEERLFGVRRDVPEFLDIPQETPQPTPEPIIPEKGAPLGPIFKRRDVVIEGNVTKTIIYEEGKGLYMQNVGHQLFGSNYTKAKAERVPPVLLNNTFDTNEFDLEDLLKLATDPNSGYVTSGGLREAEALYQFKKEHSLSYKVVNPTRPDKEFAQKANPDFLAEGEVKVVELKQLIGKHGLERQNQMTSPEQSWFATGRNLMAQRQRFFNSEVGPKTANEMLHIVDLGFVEIEYRTLAKEFFLKGVNSTNVTDAQIVFINDSMDASINHNITNSISGDINNNNIPDYNDEF